MQSLGILTAALLAVKSSLGIRDMSWTCGYPSGKNHCLLAVRQRFVLLSCSLMSLSGGRFIPQESHFFKNPLRFMLIPCTISWLFGRWKRTEGFTTSSIFTGKDRSACNTSCEWLQSHLYILVLFVKVACYILPKCIVHIHVDMERKYYLVLLLTYQVCT